MVPDELRHAPFLGREAVEKHLLTKGQLRSTVWVPLLRGVYVHRDVEVGADVRAQALSLRLRPGDVVAGRTAAWAHGAWVPAPGRPVPWEVTTSLTGSGRDNAVNRRRLTLRGSADWRGPIAGISVLDHDIIERGGVRLLSPVRTCFDLMRERGLVEAVVVADAFGWAGALDLLTLSVYAADRRRWPAVRQTRVALNLANAAARSPGESRLRMVMVLAGLPEPLVNVPLLDDRDVVLGIPDLTVLGSRQTVGAEYDGRYHEDDDQQGLDRRRENRVTAIGGMPLLRYDRTSVWSQRPAVLREVCALSGLRPRNDLEDADFRRPRPSRAW